MIDAYTHLDLSSTDPIADMQARMADAGIHRALAVETWKGDNLAWLQRMLAAPSPQFRVVPCYRPEQKQPSPELLQNAAVVGLRVRTVDLHQIESLAPWLASSGNWLVPHAESGIGPLRKELIALVRRAPGLHIYLPHLGWPRRDKVDDPEWEDAVAELCQLPGIVAGISAIAHFSHESFPHSDVEPFAARLIEKFGPASVVAASDYPLFEKSLYTRYMQLAQDWIRRVDPHWLPRFEQALDSDRN
jgi:hypothetical protein